MFIREKIYLCIKYLHHYLEKFERIVTTVRKLTPRSYEKPFYGIFMVASKYESTRVFHYYRIIPTTVTKLDMFVTKHSAL